MLKTLEEPASFVHLILLTDRLGEVLPTIRSRCQLVRFDAPSPAEVAEQLAGHGVAAPIAAACARLGMGDAEQALVLAQAPGRALRAAAQEFAQAVLAGRSASDRPWGALLGAVRETGQALTEQLESDKAADLEFYPKKERKRVDTEWTERIRRGPAPGRDGRAGPRAPARDAVARRPGRPGRRGRGPGAQRRSPAPTCALTRDRARRRCARPWSWWRRHASDFN